MQATAPSSQVFGEATALPVDWSNANSNQLAVPAINSDRPAYSEGSWEQVLTSVKDLPSQVVWLQNSLQQRENDIISLSNEVHLCKAELSELRGQVLRVPALENELRATKESLEKIHGILLEGKGKGIR